VLFIPTGATCFPSIPLPPKMPSGPPFTPLLCSICMTLTAIHGRHVPSVCLLLYVALVAMGRWMMSGILVHRPTILNLLEVQGENEMAKVVPNSKVSPSSCQTRWAIGSVSPTYKLPALPLHTRPASATSAP